jgi:hypothetical protein
MNAIATLPAPPPPKPTGKVLQELVEEAVGKLLDYNRDPFIEDYLVSEGIPKSTPNPVLATLLPDALLGRHSRFEPDLGHLLDRLDGLQENGRQTAFLFTLPRDGRADLLARLRSPDFLAERLRLAGFADRFDQHLRVWVAAEPELSDVRLDLQQERLVLKWVKTRQWQEEMGDRLSPQRIKKTERVAQLVRFDLRTGDSEVLLPPLQTFPEQTLAQELDACQALTTGLLGFSPFERVDLKPAVRRAIEDGAVDLTAWSVLRTGAGEAGKLEWHGRPQKHHGAPAGLPAGAEPYTGLQSSYEETFFRGRNAVRIPVTVDAVHGSVEIRKPCLPEEHAAILDRVRIWLLQISDPDLRDAAVSRRETASLVARVDEKLQAGLKVVDGGELMRQEGATFQAVEATLQQIVVQNTARFEIVYLVADPQTGKVREHATRPPGAPEGAVQLREVPQGWLFKLTRVLGIRVFRRMVRDTWNLLFSIAYALLLYGASRPVLELLGDTVPGQTMRVAVLTLMLIVVVAFWRKMVGKDAAGEAAHFVLDVIAKVEGVFKTAQEALFDRLEMSRTVFGELVSFFRWARR